MADAKNRFSELVNKALSGGPQQVSRREDRVVVLSDKDYRKLAGKQPDFIEFLLEGNLDTNGVDLKRDKSHARKVNL